jgi:hypothetical protein
LQGVNAAKKCHLQTKCIRLCRHWPGKRTSRRWDAAREPRKKRESAKWGTKTIKPYGSRFSTRVFGHVVVISDSISQGNAYGGSSELGIILQQQQAREL